MKPRVRVLSAIILAGTVLLSGCASVWHGTAQSFDRAPNGLTRSDDAIRRALVVGSFAEADRQARSDKSGAPSDVLLRALYQGTTSYYAGDYRNSIRALAEADALIERRFTKSMSAGALSLAINDMALPYMPSRTEQLFVRYYAMMAQAQLGDTVASLVEARRLGRMLEDDATHLQSPERSLHAVLRDAAGAVFESAGERNDALVSYRNAALLRGVTPAQVDGITLAAPDGDSATLVIMIESGFVAHRVDQNFLLPVANDQLRTGRVNRDGYRDRDRDVAAPVAVIDSIARPVDSTTPPSVDALIASLSAESVFAEPANRDGSNRDSVGAALAGSRDHDSNDAPYARSRGHRGNYRSNTRWVQFAWPTLRRSPMPSNQLALMVDSASRTLSDTVGDVTMAIAEDLRRARPAMLARLAVRATAKTAVADAFDGDQKWVGSLISFLGNSVERADTRSWQLLPGSVRTVRVTVPSGSHEPQLQVGGDFERVTVRLPHVNLTRGSVTVIDARVWRDATGMVAGRLSPEPRFP